MKLLFVTSKKPVSRLIRWALDSDCSHFAVCFDEEANGSGIAFHSVLGGATLVWFGEFKKHYEIVHAISFKSTLTLQDEESIYQQMLAEYSGQGYDVPAFLFWAWRALLRKTLGFPFPKKNDLAVRGYNLCTGLAGGFKWIDRWAVENGVDLEMVKPHELYDRLMATGYFEDETEWARERCSST